MNKNALIGAAVGLLVGFLAGNWYGYKEGQETARLLIAAAGPGVAAPAGMPAGMPPPGMPPAGAGLPNVDVAQVNQRIELTKRVVEKDPKNVGAWIALGNDYFDTRQFQKSIDAYGEALRLNPANPDVLTDRGVMYEQTGDFDKALADFEQAQKVAPTHVQSAFNIGIVWSKHKLDDKKALTAWKRVVELAPTSPQAGDARRFIAELEQKGIK